jgi:hypothetical protein
MSIPALGVSAVELGLSLFFGSVFIRPRKIAGFVADVTIEERGVDQMRLTEHPVEMGANITDHAYKMPARLTLTVGFSNSGLKAAFNPKYIDTQYQNFLSLQASRQPFGIQTGKRLYKNMLIVSLMQVTDEKYENALFLVLECQEILMATTQVVSVPPSSQQSNPKVNGATGQNGSVAAGPAPSFNPTAKP